MSGEPSLYNLPRFWILPFYNRCPACGKGKLYEGWLKTFTKCPQCGFAIGSHDAADGPAFFALSIMAVVITLSAVWFELSMTPSIWWHITLWPIIGLVGSIILLRWFKAALIHLQYKHLKKTFND